jgi:tape measure domain-containing protein
MPTVSTYLKMMDQFSRPLQRVTNQVNTAIVGMERMRRLVERPAQLNINANNLQRQLSGVQRVVQNAQVDVTFNARQAVRRAQMLKTLIQKQLDGIQARIRIELPASLTVMFTNLQRLVMKFIAATRRLQGVAGNQASAQQQIIGLQQKILQLQNQINSSTRQGGQASAGWLSNLQGIAAAYLSFQGIGAAARISDDYINSLARIEIINDGLQTTAEMQDKIFAAAERARGSYTDMAGVIGRMGILAKDAFKSNNELVAFSELMQKSFRVGGASTMEQQAGMYQLSQAMAAGKLQGDEFRSIMENAPMLSQAIAKFTGKSMGDLKEMSAEGTITADIIKGAMFSAADEINQKLKTMPMTFGDVTNKIKNFALQTFGPVIERINQMLNSETGKQFVTNIQSAIGTAATSIDWLLTAAVNMYSFFTTNWPMIEPIVIGLVTAFSLYKVAMMASATWTGILTAAQLINASAKAAMTGATLAATSATAAQTAAQWGLNAALLASPITWVILGIIALIALFYAVVGAINRFAGTSLSATGMIAGAFVTVGAVIGNIFIGLLQLVFGVIEYWYNWFTAFANFFGNLFNDPIGAVIHLFSDMADNVLGILEKIAKAMDAVFGSSMSDTVAGWRGGLADLTNMAAQKYGNGTYEEKFSKLDIEKITGDLGRFDYGEAYNIGYDWGADLFGKDEESGVGAAKAALDSTQGMYKGMIPNIGKVDEVGKIKDTVDISSEDLKTMRELAEMKNIQNFVTLTPQLTFGDTHVRQDGRSIEEIVANIAESMEQQLVSTARSVLV